MNAKTFALAAGLSLSCLFAPSSAVAQDRASAEELFQLGKGAMARHELLKACNYFQASLTAEFALGTLLNLAICHEQAGKIASAWAEYRTLEDRSRQETPPQLDRAQFAHDHAEALRPRLSRVRIVVSPEAVMIGASERTRSETIEILASKCFQFGHVERVYEIPIPTERTFMHLDMVFTVVDRGKVVWFPEEIGRAHV